MECRKKDIVRSIVGLGVNSPDGHQRLTEGENFHLHDGSEESHALMQDLCIRINHELEARGQRLEHLSRSEFVQLLSDLDAVD